MEALILQLFGYVFAGFLVGILVYFRLHKKYKREPVTNRWSYIDRNPVELVIIIFALALASILVPGVPEMLKALLVG